MQHELSTRVGGARDRDPKFYQQALERENSQEAEYLVSIRLQVEKNPFRRSPLCNMYSLWHPDQLHLLHLGILKMMMNSLVG